MKQQVFAFDLLERPGIRAASLFLIAEYEPAFKNRSQRGEFRELVDDLWRVTAPFGPAEVPPDSN
jgi:hypothetical protein